MSISQHFTEAMQRISAAWNNPPAWSWHTWGLLWCVVILASGLVWTIHTIDVAERKARERRNTLRNLAGGPDELTAQLRKEGLL